MLRQSDIAQLSVPKIFIIPIIKHPTRVLKWSASGSPHSINWTWIVSNRGMWFYKLLRIVLREIWPIYSVSCVAWLPINFPSHLNNENFLFSLAIYNNTLELRVVILNYSYFLRTPIKFKITHGTCIIICTNYRLKYLFRNLEIPILISSKYRCRFPWRSRLLLSSERSPFE